jgi:hypothetical protein
VNVVDLAVGGEEAPGKVVGRIGSVDGIRREADPVLSGQGAIGGEYGDPTHRAGVDLD